MVNDISRGVQKLSFLCVKQKFDVKPTISYNFERKPQAGVAELADAADLKSAGAILVGSSPTLGTNHK